MTRVVGTARMNQEMKMKTTVLTVGALVLSTSFALAQPSQGQAGAATGPTSNSATSERPSGMNNGGMNNGSGMQSGSTTGMSSGGGSGMTASGGANGNPGSMPKTTTGPTGAASKDESPAK